MGAAWGSAPSATSSDSQPIAASLPARWQGSCPAARAACGFKGMLSFPLAPRAAKRKPARVCFLQDLFFFFI